MLLLTECLLLLFISLSTQSGNFWIHPHIDLNETQLLTFCVEIYFHDTLTLSTLMEGDFASVQNT